MIHHERDVREEQHHTYRWREQAIIEWSWHVNSIVACCHSAKLCAHVARDFRSQQYQANVPAQHALLILSSLFIYCLTAAGFNTAQHTTIFRAQYHPETVADCHFWRRAVCEHNQQITAQIKKDWSILHHPQGDWEDAASRSQLAYFRVTPFGEVAVKFFDRSAKSGKRHPAWPFCGSLFLIERESRHDMLNSDLPHRKQGLRLFPRTKNLPFPLAPSPRGAFASN